MKAKELVLAPEAKFNLDASHAECSSRDFEVSGSTTEVVNLEFINNN